MERLVPSGTEAPARGAVVPRGEHEHRRHCWPDFRCPASLLASHAGPRGRRRRGGGHPDGIPLAVVQVPRAARALRRTPQCGPRLHGILPAAPRALRVDIRLVPRHWLCQVSRHGRGDGPLPQRRRKERQRLRGHQVCDWPRARGPHPFLLPRGDAQVSLSALRRGQLPERAFLFLHLHDGGSSDSSVGQVRIRRPVTATVGPILRGEAEGFDRGRRARALRLLGEGRPEGQSAAGRRGDPHPRGAREARAGGRPAEALVLSGRARAVARESSEQLGWAEQCAAAAACGGRETGRHCGIAVRS
mmetsp:Transcript_9077/g.18962  ORF Transcript_9077/g.18962 Transcript_9077/m.18962 type:complete len:303 (-) Transcript_9077:304-1212(-)